MTPHQFETTAEQREPIELPVIGTFPPHVAGVLYRTEPARYKVPGSKYQLHHWFDGFTQLHRFQLVPRSSGLCKVLYNSRRQVDALIEEVRKTGSLRGMTPVQKRNPCANFFQKAKAVFEIISRPELRGLSQGFLPTPKFPLDSTVKEDFESNHSDRRDLIKHIDPETLEPLGVTRQEGLHPEPKGPLSSAHPKLGPITGDLYNYNLAFGRHRQNRNSGHYHWARRAGCLPALLLLESGLWILCIWSALFVAGAVKVLWERNLLDAMRFDPETPTRWYIVDRKGGRGFVATFVSPAFFSFHTINAWQMDDVDGEEEVPRNGTTDIICHLIQYHTDEMLHRVFYECLISTGSKVEKHYGSDRSRLRLATAELTIASDAVGDLPTINLKFTGRKTRFVYNLCTQEKSSFFDGTAKVDGDTQESTIWSRGRHTPGEAIFVPEPGAEAEDAGFLLSVVLNGDIGSSYLLCLMLGR
ncbi:hypothetical protein BO82DRAFT_435849 [Aspergillus uvarum CBS 121591]|uniref:Carotenoid oxygenase n=1 Tax=Aspergillus uvarum CBS 121591 TaxID=1448315 RepID=A0A319BXJ7_9EURO|nr:hypothetical protein BO82DRAFT_435849 [Aspergillus uvarum CBS 121591]PYH77454.1 hypothetical protein BO82DRAFT_435849 [Aspergillus uvarum CBS 121591]